MKCIRSITDPNEIYRVSEVEAHHAVQSGRWRLTSKETWRAAGRKYASRELIPVPRYPYQ